MVKRYPNGPMSTHLHSMDVGEYLSVRGPIPKYKWEPNKFFAIMQCLLTLGMRQLD